MELITNIDELRENARTLNSYLKSDDESEKDFVLSLIKNGKCFVIFEDGDARYFYPSKFLGYKKNNKEKHNTARNEKTIHGGLTNQRIKKLLECSPLENEDFEIQYEKFCRESGTETLSQRHTFWEKKIIL